MARKRTTSQPTAADLTDAPTVSPSTVTRRRILGVCGAVFTVIAFIALISYDWRDISWLSNPPSPPSGLPANQIGHIGAWITFFGYGIAGLAYRYFFLPILAIVSGMMIHGRVPYFRLRLIWLIGFYVSIACIFQVCGGDTGQTIPLLDELNLRPNAGGAIGQWIVTDFLRPLLGTLGMQFLLWALMLLFLSLFIGFRNIILGVMRVISAAPQALAPEEDDIRSDLRRRAEAQQEGKNGDVSAAPKSGLGFFAALFRKRQQAAETDEAAHEPSIRDLLAQRTAASQHQDWAPQPVTTPSDPLFAEREPAKPVLPARKPVPAPTPVPVPAPVPVVQPEPVDEPFELTGESPSILKPVSPLNAVTAPAVAGNDNDLVEEKPEFEDYGLPTTALLDPIPPALADHDDGTSAIAAIESVFQQFGIAARVVNQVRGPVLTQFEVLPEKGVKLERFATYERNLLMALRAETIRILAPIPARDVVGIEVPNTIRQSVTLREILEGPAWKEAERKMALPMALGKMATGGDLILDLAEMPHMLVAGGTGSGKSVALNDILTGLLMCRKPEQMRLIMVDPKRVEFTVYEDLPHLLNAVVVEAKKATFCLKWARIEMTRRYTLLQRYGARNISDYNKRVEHPIPHRDNPTATLPYIVIVIDELADLMQDVKDNRDAIEGPITSLTQKARAAGIHLIIATQRPTTNIITGTIKANIPCRIALRVTQGNDSRTILDTTGAEKLIGKGDMLVALSGKKPIRSQAAWISDAEIERVCTFIKDQAGPSFDQQLSGTLERIVDEKPADDFNSLVNEFIPAPEVPVEAIQLGSEDDKSDEGYYQRALEIIRQTGRFSTSVLQRRLKIGYNKAARISDMLIERGIVSETGKAGGSREILVDLNELLSSQAAGGGEAQPAPVADEAESTPFESPRDPVSPDYTYDVADAQSDDDFDLGDLDPTSLDDPEIIHPSHV